VALEVQGEACRMSVVDDGLGMSPPQVNGLFEPFERLGREQSDIAGTGIGLCLTRHLVEAMGGTIHANSCEGQGSTFTVCLPMASGSAASTHAESARPPGCPALPPGLRVLYVDDDPVNRVLMGGIISLQQDWSMREAANANEGLALAVSEPFDLMMIDLLMPGVDGYELLARVRAHEELARLPCIAVSAYAAPDDIETALRRGFAGYITKPILVSEWCQTVKEVLERSQMKTAP
jgi:CheY-like chemotaxis protein